MGVTANERILQPMWGEADRLMDAVNALPTTTEAGLRAKVLNVVLTNTYMLWKDRTTLMNFARLRFARW